MATDKRHDDEMREEYDFSKAVRGKFYRSSNKRPKLPAEMDINSLPDPAEMLRQAREERDFQLLMALGDDLLRPIASKHGLNWDEMNEDERERFIRKIVRE